MKTLQGFAAEIRGSEELKKEFIEAAQTGEVIGFCERHDCPVTQEELQEYLESLSRKDSELSVDELEDAAGGYCDNTGFEIGLSIAFVGIACAIMAALSAAGIEDIDGDKRHIGQRDKRDGRLCSKDH